MDTSSFSFERTKVAKCVIAGFEALVSNVIRNKNSDFCRFVTAFILNMSLVASANSSGWLSTLSVEDVAGNVAVLEFGFDMNATDQIDPGMAEVEIPPSPPRGEFYAFWSLPETGIPTLRDIRQTPADGDSLTFFLSVQNRGAIEIVWEADQLRQGLRAASLTDIFGREHEFIDMFQQDSITLENNNLRYLMLVVYPRMAEVITYVKAENAVVSRSHEKQARVEPITIYPNPGNNRITVRLAASITEIREIAIVNVAGQKIRTFNHHLFNETGPLVTWDGRTDRNQLAASGVYWALVRSESVSFTRSFAYLR